MSETDLTPSQVAKVIGHRGAEFLASFATYGELVDFVCGVVVFVQRQIAREGPSSESLGALRFFTEDANTVVRAQHITGISSDMPRDKAFDVLRHMEPDVG